MAGQRRHKLGFVFLRKKKSKRNNNKLSSFASATVFSCQSSYIPTSGCILYNRLEKDHDLQELDHNHQDLIISCRNTCITYKNRVQTFRNQITRDSSFREMGAAMRPSGQITSNLLLTGQTGQTKLTSKLDFPGNLQLAAFTILAMFLKQCIKHKLPIFQSVCTFI